MTPAEAAEREAFERFAHDQGYDTERMLNAHDEYRSLTTTSMFDAWQAARALPPAAAQEGWVSIADAVPPMGEVVLVYLPKNEFVQYGLDEWDELRECPVSFSTASVVTGHGWRDHDVEEVTHWKRLVAPDAAAPVAPLPVEGRDIDSLRQELNQPLAIPGIEITRKELQHALSNVELQGTFMRTEDGRTLSWNELGKLAVSAFDHHENAIAMSAELSDAAPTPARGMEQISELVRLFEEAVSNCESTRLGDSLEPTEPEDVNRARTALLAVVAEMAKGAERYRLARDIADSGPWEMEDGAPAVVVFVPIPEGLPSHWDHENYLDAAIDAKLKELDAALQASQEAGYE